MSQAAIWQLTMFILFILPLILGLTHILLTKTRSKLRRAHIMLSYTTAVYIAVEGTFFGLQQIFHPQMVAEFVGWSISPFIREVGMANLSYGILGLTSFWRRNSFRTATILGSGMFLFFAFIGHLYDIIVTGNFQPGNAGVIFFTDIFIPIIFAILLTIFYKEKRRRPAQ